MTHAELRRRFPGPGLEPADCPGELEPSNRPDELGIETHWCPACGHTISYDLERHVILNDYPDQRPEPDIKGLIAELAREKRVR